MNVGMSLETLPQGQENELKQYRKIKDSLSLSDEQNIIFKDMRIVIPRCFEIIVVKLAHIGHQGLVKTKSLLRNKLFFLNMDKMVAKKLAFCIPCQFIRKQNHRQ